MAIKYGNTTGHSIKKFLESPFAGKDPKLISKDTKTAAAEAALTAAEAIAVVDSKENKRQSSRPWAAAPSPWRSL
jgi:N-formylglutamate amidohydrolase